MTTELETKTYKGSWERIPSKFHKEEFHLGIMIDGVKHSPLVVLTRTYEDTYFITVGKIPMNSVDIPVFNQDLEVVKGIALECAQASLSGGYACKTGEHKNFLIEV